MKGSREYTTAAEGTAPSRLCVVVPCFDEAQVLPLLYEALCPVLKSIPGVDYQIIFVDDGSSDGTLDIMNQLTGGDTHVRVFSLSRNFGHQVALTAGLDVADGDAVVLMDSDLQHPPILIPRMVELWREGNDVVSAVREENAGASWSKDLASRFFYWLINRLSDTRIVPGAADFVLLSRAACHALRRMPERHRFLRGMISWIGFRRAFIPFSAPARAAGKTKYSVPKMIAFAFDAVFSFSPKVVRLIGRLGMAIVALGALYLSYELFRYLAVRDAVRGWPSLIALIFVLGGLQLLAIGISGEYLARIFEESKNRPLYFFKQTPGSVEE